MNATSLAKPIQAFCFSVFGTIDLILNCVAIWALRKSQAIGYFTKILIIVKCSINIVGLVAVSGYGSLCIGMGRYIIGEQVALVAGSLAMFSMYGSFALQTCMAISRMIVFRQGTPVIFSRKTCISSAVACVLYGAVFATIALHPCCSAGVILSQGRHGFVGNNKKVIGMVTIANDLLTFPTMLVCYIRALMGMEDLRRAAQSETITWAEVKHEVKVLVQFLMISSAWALHVTFFRLLQFKMIKLDLCYALTISEINRYIFWSIDPIVCFIFLEEIRKIVVSKIRGSNESGNQVEMATAGKITKKENNEEIFVQEL